MAVNFALMPYLPNYEFWARTIVVTPLFGAPYTARGIYNTRGTVVDTDFGRAVISDQETIVDILEFEFAVLPIQGDLIDIPAYQGIPAAGLFEVTDASTNGGGETTLVVRKLVAAAKQP
jgi:hypothetical protein